MIVRVDQGLCSGCGACVDECSAGAIQLVDQWAVIDNALCTQCKECIDACPNGAIMVAPELVYNTSLMAPSGTESYSVLYREPIAPPQTTALDRSRVALSAVAALSFVGREIISRLAEALVAALEHRFTQPKTASLHSSDSFCTQINKAHGEGRRKQLRRRRRRADHRDRMERR